MKRSDKKKLNRENVAFREGWQLATQLMEKAIKETHGIGTKRYQSIMKRREEIARIDRSIMIDRSNR